MTESRHTFGREPCEACGPNLFLAMLSGNAPVLTACAMPWNNTAMRSCCETLMFHESHARNCPMGEKAGERIRVSARQA